MRSVRSAYIVHALLSICFEATIIFSSANNTCSSNGNDPCQEAQSLSFPNLGRPLRPSDLPEPTVFTDFQNTTIILPNGIRQEVASGKATQINNVVKGGNDVLADLAVLSQAVPRSSIEEILNLLRDYKDYDDDPDTVDGMPSYEIFVDNPELYTDTQTLKYRDVDPKFVAERKVLRGKLNAIMKPYIDTIITPIIHERYPDACTSRGPNRLCTPCYSLIRRYQHGQRQSHATHHDGHAVVTAVISLSDYDIDYRGGLYAATGHGQKQFLALNKGDAVIHQSGLLHGVQVHDVLDNPTKTERWSWILWYRDSPTCDDFGYEWFADCAYQGDALCQQLHSTKVGEQPGISGQETSKQVLDLNIKAAAGGAGMAAVKVARAYLHQLPSVLPFDIAKAAEYYQLAIQSDNPDGHFGMAQLILVGIMNDYKGKSNEGDAWKDLRLAQVVKHLELASYSGHAFAQFNLGMVHTFGYNNTDPNIDTDLAGEWFEFCGLPEGYFVASHQAKSVGNLQRENQMMERAKIMGHFAPWRAQARHNTGSGGATGVDLNLPWPPNSENRQPPRF